MRCKAPDKTFFADLRDLNREFLALLRRCRPTPETRALGLGAPIAEPIRRLSPDEVDFVATTPCLLAGLTGLPGVMAVGEASPASPQDRHWYDAARVFTASLMTYLRQVDHRDPLIVALCLGPALAEKLAALPLREMQTRAGVAVSQLEARFADNPRFWPDILKAARSGDEELRMLACLTSIPLCLTSDAFRGRPPSR